MGCFFEREAYCHMSFCCSLIEAWPMLQMRSSRIYLYSHHNKCTKVYHIISTGRQLHNLSPLVARNISFFSFSLSIWFIYALFLCQYFLSLDNHFSLSPGSLTKCLDRATSCVWMCPTLRLALRPRKPYSSSCLSERIIPFFLASLTFSSCIFH